MHWWNELSEWLESTEIYLSWIRNSFEKKKKKNNCIQTYEDKLNCLIKINSQKSLKIPHATFLQMIGSLDFKADDRLELHSCNILNIPPSILRIIIQRITKQAGPNENKGLWELRSNMLKTQKKIKPFQSHPEKPTNQK